MKKSTIPLLTALFIGVAAATSQAAVIVQWGEADLANTNPGNIGIVDGSPVQNFTTPSTFVAGTSTSPTVGTEYYPSATGRSPIFNSAASADVTTSQIQNNSNYDRIRLVAPASPGATHAETMVVWEKSVGGFLTVDTTLESLTLGGFSSGTNPSVYFLLQKDDNSWYSTLGSNNFGATTISIADASSATWNAFTPITGGAATIGAVTAIDMANIKAVGFYSVHDTDPAGVLGIQVGYFQATAIPEPAAALLGSLGMLALLRRRR